MGEAFADLLSLHPDLKRQLYTDDGKLRATAAAGEKLITLLGYELKYGSLGPRLRK